VHHSFGVHFFESAENGEDDGSGLMWLKFVLGFNFVVELSSFKQLYDNVERIV